MRDPLKFIKYCWQVSKKAQALSNKSRMWLFYDMLCFGYKYESTTIKYMKLKWYKLDTQGRLSYHSQLMYEKNELLLHYKLLAFLSKYSSVKYEHPRLIAKRHDAYTKMYNMGKGCSVRYNTWIMTTHFMGGRIKIGDKVSFGRNTDIDFSGGLTIGNGVVIAEGCTIMTHGHDYLGSLHAAIYTPNSHRAYATPLSIGNNVSILANCIIMPGVKSIGENSIISAGTIVTKPVPPNSLVSGNPAKIQPIPEGMRTLFMWKEK